MVSSPDGDKNEVIILAITRYWIFYKIVFLLLFGLSKPSEHKLHSQNNSHCKIAVRSINDSHFGTRMLSLSSERGVGGMKV